MSRTKFLYIFIALFLNSNIFAHNIGIFEHIAHEIEEVYFNPFLPNRFTKEFALDNFAYQRKLDSSVLNEKDTHLKIPTMAGRAAFFNDNILLKGTGPNPEWSGDKNLIYYGNIGRIDTFDGKFSFRESLISMYNAYYLNSLGVSTAKPLAILKLKSSSELPRAIFVREFAIQTRLSDLWSMDKVDALTEINKAKNLFARKQGVNPSQFSTTQYYFALLHKLAMSIGRMQAAGFQHGALHAQQITLFGEVDDLGTGSWFGDPEFNKWFLADTYIPYFKFQFQPLLVQNMFVRTHSVTNDPPIELGSSSKTLNKQSKSLLGILKLIDPLSAQDIEKLKPVEYFWKVFNHHYQLFNKDAFRKEFKPSIHFDYDKNNQWYPKYILTGEKPKKFSLYQYNLRKISQFHEKEYFDYVPIQNSYKQIKTDLYEVPLNKNGEIALEGDIVVAIGAKKWNEVKGTPWYQYDENLPESIWNILLKKGVDKSLDRLIATFDSAVKNIFQMGQPEELRNALLMYALTTHAQLDFGLAHPDSSIIQFYETFVEERWKKGNRFLGELIDQCIGECHDTAMLSLILGRVIQKYDDRFRFYIVKTLYDISNTHYFVLSLAPNNRMYVIDPISYKSNLVGLWEDMLNTQTPLFIGEHEQLKTLFSFDKLSHEECSQLLL